MELIAQVLLWGFNLLGLCSTIAGDFAMYISGKLISRPDVITIYVACQPSKVVLGYLRFAANATYTCFLFKQFGFSVRTRMLPTW